LSEAKTTAEQVIRTAENLRTKNISRVESVKAEKVIDTEVE
jgi:hypothetical protein